MSGIDPTTEEVGAVLREALTTYIAEHSGRKAEVATQMLDELDWD